MSTLSPLYLPHRRRRFNGLRHFFRLLCMTVLFVSVSVGAVVYSLGYEPNFLTHKIQETGSIVIDGDSSISDLTVKIDGRIEGREIPFRRTHLLPGIYTISVQKEGYQDWVQTVHVVESQVVSFHYLVLVLNTPLSIAADSHWLSSWQASQSSRLQIRQNEIWLDGSYLTRVAEDIIQGSFYPGEHAIVYQTASGIWILDPKSRVTSKLLTITSSQRIKYLFRSGGRVLAYEDPVSHIVKAVRLYDY